VIFIDATIFMYAAGVDHAYKNPCSAFLRKIAQSSSANQYCVNSEILQEIIHRYKSIHRETVGYSICEAIMNLNINILAVETIDIAMTITILKKHPLLPTRDAVHIATMIKSNTNIIISYDKDFDQYMEIKRVIP